MLALRSRLKRRICKSRRGKPCGGGWLQEGGNIEAQCIDLRHPSSLPSGNRSSRTQDCGAGHCSFLSASFTALHFVRAASRLSSCSQRWLDPSRAFSPYTRTEKLVTTRCKAKDQRCSARRWSWLGVSANHLRKLQSQVAHHTTTPMDSAGGHSVHIAELMKLRHLSLGVGDGNSKEAFMALRDALLGGGSNGDGGSALARVCDRWLYR